MAPSLPFEFTIEGPPVSQQTRRRERLRAWTREVRAAAGSAWPEDAAPTMQPVAVRLTYFYDAVALDIDNIAKPVLDALKGLVYADDGQVTEILIRKRDLAFVRVADPSDRLLAALERGTEFLHIVVESADDREGRA